MGRTNKHQSSSFWYARRRASSAPATPRPEPAEDSPPIGCMSMVHYLIFAPGAGCVGRPPTGSSNVAIVTPHDSIIHSPRRLGDGGDKKSSGFDAPRNSLDLDVDNPNDIQIGVQIEPVFDALARTSMRRHKPTAPSSEAETPRTPSLVARLMGIDGLPDQPLPSPAARHKKPSSTTKKQHHTTITATDDDKENHYCSSAPSPASNREKKKRVIPESMNRREPLRSLSCNVGTIAGGEMARSSSLPETPRASTSARASWDGARLSLQALKENVLDRAAQYMSMPSSPTSAGGGGKNKSFTSRRRRDEKERERVAKEHAREILRQAKENVASRKKASSKQTSGNKSTSPATDKENVAPAASPAANVEDKLVVVIHPGKPKSQGTENPLSSQKSPRVPLAPRQQQLQQHPPPQRAKPSRPPPPPPPLDPPPPTRARRPDGCERFATRVKKPAVTGGQGQPLAPASSSSSSPAMAAPPLAPASSSPPPVVHHVKQCPSPATEVPLEEDPEYGYVRSVLERGGFMRRSPPAPPPRRPCHSSSPVDPIVFHLLELDLPADEASAEAVRLGPLRHRWNRKLLFHLTQELLTDLVDADTPAAMAVVAPAMTGVPLLRSVWRKVRSFPAADCKVVGDIDALVAADFESRRRRLVSHPAVAEEAGAVAEEVVERVLEALIGECVAEFFSLSTVPGGLTRSSSSSSSSRAQAR